MKVIPAFKLIPEPLSEEAIKLPGFKWAGEGVGKRHQLGGKPTRWIDDEQPWPCCPHCKEKMTFYAQLDSINDEFNVADACLIYVFLCFNCNEVFATLNTG